MEKKRDIRKAEEIARRIFSGHPGISVRLWDGTLLHFGNNPEFTLVFRNPRAFRQILLKPDALTAGAAFINNDLDIEGDLFDAMGLLDYFATARFSSGEKLKILTHLMTL